MRILAWILGVTLSTLSDWNQELDENMRPYRISDKRGTASKVTMESIRHIVDQARRIKEQGYRLRLKSFVTKLKEDLDLDLSRKTVQDILIANDLWRPQTRKKRPQFYQNLCQQIPNGVLSLDGSTMDVTVGDRVFTYNLELGVDVGSFCHTAFEITPTETSAAILSVLKQHQQAWGLPLGVIFDHGSANLGAPVTDFLHQQQIIILPAGPSNPKGNGSDEGAFSQLKQAIGDVHIDTSSAYALGESVLRMLVSLYTRMRNKMALRTPRPSPADHMQRPITAHEQDEQKARLLEFQARKAEDDTHRAKIDRLHHVIRYHNIRASSPELERAKVCLKAYDQEALIKTEEAFLRAVNRDQNRCNLAYFFGILKNIQQELDDQRYREYCQEHYSYQIHLEKQRLQEEPQSSGQTSVTQVVELMLIAIGLGQDFLRNSALNRCKRRIEELLSSVQYIGPLLKSFQEALGARKDIDVKQKEQAFTHIERLINETAAA
ncbi:MAG: hypothetical protein KGY41_08635 [Desulfovermiculus sp.]|nr:hypothetical protein [Desulfovermiculus sp.]